MKLTPSEALQAISAEQQLAIHEERKLSAGAIAEILDSVGGHDGLSPKAEEHLLRLLDEIIGNLRDQDPPRAIANSTHAIQVLLGVDDGRQVPPEIHSRLGAIVRLSGLFS